MRPASHTLMLRELSVRLAGYTATVRGSSMRLAGHAFAAFGREVLALVLLAALVHALVLQFVFPGAYDPLWPNHSDFYIAPEWAHSPHALLDALKGPRPLGFLFFTLTGALGVRGAMACNLAVVLVSAAMTAVGVRRLAGVTWSAASLLAALLYFFLLFTFPTQYIWSTYDVFSQLAYGLAVLGLVVARARAPVILQTAIFAAGFLAKETYILTLLFFAAVDWFAASPTDRPARIKTLVAIMAGFVLAFVQGKLAGSVYLGAGAAAGAPYHIDLSPASVARAWVRFAAEAGLAVWVFVAMTSAALLVCARESRRQVLLVLALAIGGLLAWLPNTLLPNHLIFGYSWNGAYLLYAPVLALPVLLLGRFKSIPVALLALAVLVPALSGPAYANSKWYNEQQARQRRLMNSIQARMRTLGPNVHSVLVTGIDFPFSPFEHPRSLYQYAARLPSFSVVVYEPKSRGDKNQSAAAQWIVRQPSPVERITPEITTGRSFDQVWMFDEDGNAIDARLSRSDSAALAAAGLDVSRLPEFPGVMTAMGLGDPKTGGGVVLDGYHFLGCGIRFMGYHQPRAALTCLKASQTRIPENPYPYFFSGLAEEALGHMPEARADFVQAVLHDDKANPNPGFKVELAHLEAGAAAASR